MAQQTILTIPAVPANSGEGTPLAEAFRMINENFTELYQDESQGEVNSIIAGSGISVDTSTGDVTITNTITNNNQLTNGAGYVDGTGTANFVPVWTDGNTLGDSIIYDNGNGFVGINTQSYGGYNEKLGVNGNFAVTGDAIVTETINAIRTGSTADNPSINLGTTVGVGLYTGYGKLGFATGAQARMTIDTLGYVGIGTTDNYAPLHVKAPSDLSSLIESTVNESRLFFKDTNTTTYYRNFIGSRGNELIFGTNNGVTARIDSSGKFNIDSSSTPTLQFYNTDTSISTGQEIGRIQFFTNDNSYFPTVVSSIDSEARSSFANSDLVFRTGSPGSVSEIMRLESTRAVRFGTTSDNNMRYSITDGELILNQTYGNFNTSLIVDRTEGLIASFINKDFGPVGSIYMNLDSVSYNTISDYRLKEDLKALENSLDRLDNLKPVNFAWKTTGKRVDGFLAHEVQNVIPEAATGIKDEMVEEEYEVTPAVYEDVVIPAQEEIVDENGIITQQATEEKIKKILVSEAVTDTRMVPKYQGIDQAKIVPLLTAALQEANQLIKDLTLRVEALENN